ncbi:G-type lectin S-receptor-like serine/threonine-protein kinase LECRK2 [Cinnamomum micranthum f. kanehirae]|uniref:G-type lectin S-receptor-like serine/threonine-protein kinase LECRK2 n=1 Tax=Cinnamomum micranthum f. kanehirae TaxID=337451 RepID=A0A3S4NIM6_9MAGN|nr:G-type lectin S-receptor-like serine/threonine-protein kinase LECRK2 [Cinnamomum micranthum f. kanehirae]
MAILLWLMLLVASFHGSPAQNSTRTIVSGSRLVANSRITSSWPSPLGDFAFGFYNLSEDRFLVGIWFNKIPERTLAWSFNRNQPVGLGSYVELTVAGRLLLKDSQGSETYIYNGPLYATSANMKDDGNFALRNSDGSIIWQSFDSPTDTLLPGQSLATNQTLISNANGTIDFSEGRFNLEMQFDGNLLLNAYRYKDPAYWYTGSIGENGYLHFNATNMIMFVYNTTTPNQNNLSDAGNLPTPHSDYYHRATLNDVGNFQIFYYKKANVPQVGQWSWSLAWQAIEQPCNVTGLCEEYGYCFLDANQKPSCLCPLNFTLLDPNNPFKGCSPDFAPQRCGKDSSMRNFTVQVIEGVDYPNNNFADLAELKHSDRESCRKAVMDDCSCMAAVFLVAERTCLKKRMPLLNGRSDTSANGRIAFIKVATTDDTALPSPDKNKDPSSRDLAAGLIITSSVLILIFAAGAIYCRLASRPCGLIKPSSITSAIEIKLKSV